MKTVNRNNNEKFSNKYNNYVEFAKVLLTLQS